MLRALLLSSLIHLPIFILIGGLGSDTNGAVSHGMGTIVVLLPETLGSPDSVLARKENPASEEAHIGLEGNSTAEDNLGIASENNAIVSEDSPSLATEEEPSSQTLSSNIMGGASDLVSPDAANANTEINSSELTLDSDRMSTNPAEVPGDQESQNGGNTLDKNASEDPGGLRIPEILSGAVGPEYPGPAKRARVQGDVVFSIFINQGGQIESAILISSPHALLTRSAREYLSTIRFRMVEGQLEYHGDFTVRFRL